jgi:predicted phosphoribosyltransferase/dienelactone hydrolase
MFQDRTEAGRALAARLAPLVTGPCVVAPIPRGGVMVALPIVERLRAPVAMVYARKLSAPMAPELAFGAIDEDGQVVIDEATVALLGLRPGAVEEIRKRVAAEIRRRMALYRVPPLAEFLPGRAVVLVDDGLATGLTMRAAVACARRHGATEITVAVPCASEQAVEVFRREADRVVSLVVDPEFVAVGAYYVDFSPVSDEQVCAMLAEARRYAAPPAPNPGGLRVVFKNSRGFRLAGELLVPAGDRPCPVVVFAHGWGSGKASPRDRAVAEALLEAGIASFLFDFTGHGESEGTEADSTPVQQADDLRCALDILESLDEVDTGRTGLVGASSGAAVALRVAAERPRLRALALRSGNPEGAEGAVPRVTVPTLLVVGEHDVPTRAANEAVLAALAGPKRLEVVPRGDHLFEDPRARARAVALIVEWLREHLA